MKKILFAALVLAVATLVEPLSAQEPLRATVTPEGVLRVEMVVGDTTSRNFEAGGVVLDDGQEISWKMFGELPRYTEEAFEIRLQGVVIVRLQPEVRIVKTLPRGLDSEVARAVPTWYFEGLPTNLPVEVVIDFRLDRKPNAS